MTLIKKKKISKNKIFSNFPLSVIILFTSFFLFFIVISNPAELSSIIRYREILGGGFDSFIFIVTLICSGIFLFNYFISYKVRASKVKYIIPGILLLISLFGLIMLLLPSSCEGEGCMGRGFFEVVVILVFLTFLLSSGGVIAGSFSKNVKFILAKILFFLSFVLIIISSYGIISCGFTKGIKNECFSSIAKGLNRADICEKISDDKQTKFYCISHSQTMNKQVQKPDADLLKNQAMKSNKNLEQEQKSDASFLKNQTMESDKNLDFVKDMIAECSAIPKSERPERASGRGATKKSICYYDLLSSLRTSPYMSSSSKSGKFFYGYANFCNSGPINTAQEEEKLIECIILFSKGMSGPEEHLETCINIDRKHKYYCYDNILGFDFIFNPKIQETCYKKNGISRTIDIYTDSVKEKTFVDCLLAHKKGRD